jgi:hypothetical protein
VELMAAVPKIAPIDDATMVACGADWRTWVNEGLIDALVVHSVIWDPDKPLDSTRQLYRDVFRFVNGRCKVYFPVNAYPHLKLEMPRYQKALNLSQQDVAKTLALMAWEEGGAGICMECVDYGNYRESTRQALKELRDTTLRFIKKRELE